MYGNMRVGTVQRTCVGPVAFRYPMHTEVYRGHTEVYRGHTKVYRGHTEIYRGHTEVPSILYRGLLWHLEYPTEDFCEFCGNPVPYRELL